MATEYPAGLRELPFVESYYRSALRKPQVVSDAILRGVVTSGQQDRLVLAGVLGDHLGEACRRLVAVRNALYDRRYPVATALMGPLPGLAEWQDFAQWASIVPPDNMLRDLGIGEDALPAAERLHGQADLAWLEPLVSAHAAGNPLIIYSTVNAGKAPTKLWMGAAPDGEHEPTAAMIMEEHDAATLADTTADMVAVARGFLGSYLKARLGAGRRDD